MTEDPGKYDLTKNNYWPLNKSLGVKLVIAFAIVLSLIINVIAIWGWITDPSTYDECVVEMKNQNVERVILHARKSCAHLKQSP